MDANVEPNYDVPNWSETRWSGCWNPDQGVGLYLHMGRFRTDIDIWWAQTAVYLPDGRLAIDRSYGRTSSPDRVQTGSFELRQLESGWSSSFDGIGQLTSIEACAREVRGASAPFGTIRWGVTAEPASPVWDLYAGVGDRQEVVGDLHLQQGFRTSGSVTVDGEEYRLDGVGFKDHSCGVRSWDGFDRHHFVLAVMRDWTLHEISLTVGGQTRPPMGVVWEDGEAHAVTRADMVDLEDAIGTPKDCELTLEADGLEQRTLRIEQVHLLPMMINEDNDNLNGVDWDLDGDPVVLLEGIARVTAPDGSVGYAFQERSQRRSAVARPAFAEAAANR